MDYEFEVIIDECIVIGGETIVQVTQIFGETKAKIGIVGPHEVWRSEVPKSE
jgi:sRNA-binding carbon storage regulator CsrA